MQQTRDSITGGERCSRGVVLAIVLLALILRLAWVSGRPTDAASLAALPDQQEYVALARSLIETGRMSFVDPRFGDTVYAFRMPGYPAFVAVLGGGVRTVRIAQAVLDASTVLAAMWLARRWLSPRLAYVAGGLVALDPILIYFTGLLLSETLFATLLTWGVACLAHGDSPWSRARRWQTRTCWLVGVSLLIASIYVRPAAVVLPVLLVAAAGWAEMRSATFLPARKRWPVLTFVALSTVLALLPWAVRNRAIVNEWVFTTTNEGFTLYDGWHPQATGASDLSVLDELPVLPNLSEVQRSNYLRNRAIAAASDDPWRIARLVPMKLGRLWSPIPLSAEYGSRRLYVVGAALHAVPLLGLAIFGAFASSGLGRQGKALLLVPAIVTSVTYGITVGSLRYRMPIHPTLAVLAAAALCWRPTSRQRREQVEARDGD